MALINIFSKRKRLQEKGGKVEPYRYDELPGPLRVQIMHIVVAAIGRYHRSRYGGGLDLPSTATWHRMYDALLREYGVQILSNGDDPFEQCLNHLLKADVDKALDFVELAFREIEQIGPGFNFHASNSGATQAPDSAIEELNQRFKEHAIGYQFIAGEIVRIDSEFMHAEAVVPGLSLLRDEKFRGAESEFMTAHEHYRHGRHEACLVEALKAFESTMKTICTRLKWKHDANSTASTLINVIFSNGLVPEFLRNHFSGVRQALEAGVPTLRNKMAGHGQGEQQRQILTFFAGHILHLTAANILLLVEAYRARA